MPNAGDIYDMHGNVWEWVSDWYDADYYSQDSTRNPKGSQKVDYKVLRGGSWANSATYARVSARSGGAPGYGDYSLGFRCAR